jgi:hypothetical protein
MADWRAPVNTQLTSTRRNAAAGHARADLGPVLRARLEWPRLARQEIREQFRLVLRAAPEPDLGGRRGRRLTVPQDARLAVFRKSV